jgi:DNA polymerase-3 subunit beta
MRFQIDKDILSKTIQPVLNVVSAKTTLPVLINILIEAEKDCIKFSSTDLEIAITTNILLPNEKINIEEIGSIAVPGKKMGEIIREIPQGNVMFSSQKNNILRIDSHKCLFRLIGLPKDDFPKIPNFSQTSKITIEQKKIKTALLLVSPAVSHEIERYALNGIMFEFMPEYIRFVSTDGRRLAYTDKKFISADTQIKLGAKRAIVPTKTINEIQRIIEDIGEIEISLSDNQIGFSTPTTRITSRLLDAKFPEYQNYIPKTQGPKIHLNKDEWIKSLKRASLFTTIDDPVVKIDIMKNKTVISKTTSDMGDVREEIDTNYKAEDITIGFNPSYLIDAVKNIPDTDIDIEITDIAVGKTAVVRTKDENGMDYFHMVLHIELE